MRKSLFFIPSCPEVEADLTEYLEGTLSFRRRLGIRIHLMICRACRGLQKVLLALPALSKRALEAPATPAPEAQAAFLGALAKIRSGGSRDPGCGCGGDKHP